MKLPFVLKFTLSILFLLSCLPIAAQINSIKFDRVSTAQGLSHSIVNTIVQDKEGFMWFGTREGLNKYDGYGFHVYEHDPADSTSISDNNILSICNDPIRGLWIGTSKGLNRFNRATGTFTRYLYDPANPGSIPENSIQVVYSDRSGTLWVGSRSGLSKFDTNSDSFTTYQYSSAKSAKLPDNAIYTIYEDLTGVLWVSTSKGLSQFDRNTGKFTIYPHSTLPQSQHTKNSILAIREDLSGRLWIGTMGDGLKQFDRTTHSWKVYKQDSLTKNSISHDDVFSIVADSFGKLWVGTRHGLNQFDPVTEKFTHFFFDGREHTTVSGNSILSMYVDAFKVLWLGTFKSGISKYDLLSKKFTHIKFDPFNSNSLKNDFVHALYEDHAKNIWIGHGLGLDRLDSTKTTFTHYSYPPTPLIGNTLNTAHSLLEDRTGNLWIGLSGGGLKKFELESKKFTSYLADGTDSTSLPHNFVHAIHQDKSGNLWVGTRNGLAGFDVKKGSFITFKPPFSNNRPYHINYLIEDSTGLLWIATAYHGLNAFDPVKKLFMPGTYNPDRTNSAIDVLYKDRKGKFWACLNGGGLQTFDRHTSTLTPVNQPSILSKTAFNGILEDDRGNLWLSTRKRGIVKFNPNTKDIHIYDSSDGLQSNEFNKASLKSVSGEMYFGGGNGFNVFHPDSIIDNIYAPVVAITGFKVFDLPRSFENQEIVLPYNDNFFSFEYVALSYARTEKNQYAFKLENFDKDWIQAGTRRYTSYTNLDPGEYIFKVKAANRDGVWNEQGPSVKIIITPPLWKTTWAYLLYGLAFAGLLYGVRQYTINRERLRNNLKLKSLESARFQELDTLKSQFFTNISHEFRTPLTLIMSPLEELISKEKHRNEYKLMYKNARRLLQLINQLLDISKLEAGSMKLEPTPGNVIEFINLHVQSFFSIAQSKDINLDFSAGVDQLWIHFDKDKLEKILCNLLTNALKFTPDHGRISVEISVKPMKKEGWKCLQLIVNDTGIGIPADRLDKVFDRFYQVDSSFTREFEGSGIGLSLVKQLIDLHAGSISVNSQEGKGSSFFIELPCQEVLQHQDNTTLVENEFLSAYPLSPEKLLATDYVEEDMDKPAGEQAPLLLVVEDNADLRRYICKTFDEHYRVLEATNGEEGLAIALSSIPDLIISDLMMPKMDGMKLCGKLKTDERTSHIPVILLTAKATVESKLHGLQKGADDYITKPFHTEELIVRVKNLIEQRNKLRERYKRGLTIQPTVQAEPSPDEKFLQKLIQVIEKNLSRADFSVEQMENEIDMGHVQLYRKLKALTGQAPGEFLRDFRLKKAAILLSQKKGNVSQVAFEVGFNSLSYFTRSFRQMHGVTPSEFLQDAQKLQQP